MLRDIAAWARALHRRIFGRKQQVKRVECTSYCGHLSRFAHFSPPVHSENVVLHDSAVRLCPHGLRSRARLALLGAVSRLLADACIFNPTQRQCSSIALSDFYISSSSSRYYYHTVSRLVQWDKYVPGRVPTMLTSAFAQSAPSSIQVSHRKGT